MRPLRRAKQDAFDGIDDSGVFLAASMGLRESSTVTVKMLLTIELLHLATVVAQDIHLRKRGFYH